jgi:nucleotide-binding universal stress UspA family protein
MRVLITTGGSPHAGIALRLGSQVARIAGTTPTVITVIRREKYRARAEKTLLQAREILQLDLPESQMLVRVGHPAEEIIREAEQGRYDLVVVGERQHTDLVSRFLLGSTAERVVEHAPCPVLIAKGKNSPLRRILVCDSGADRPSLLDRFTTRLADLVKEEMEITVLHVMSQISAAPGIPGRQLRASAEELIREHSPEGEILERDIRILQQRARVNSLPKIRHGLVVDEIVDETHCGDYDLLVIGAHRSQGWESFLLDDLARQIISQADRPVLVVR